MAADLGDELLGGLSALGTAVFEALSFVGRSFVLGTELPFGLGPVPAWSVWLSTIAILVALAWFFDRSPADRINVLIAVATVIGIGVAFGQGRAQADQEELQRHTDFASRVAVVAYNLPEGLRVTVRNVNSSMASVVFFSHARDTNAPENWEVATEPCMQRTFLVSPRATWFPIVRKGGKDWSVGPDPAEIPFSTLLGAYGRDVAGGRQLLIAAAPSEGSPIDGCV